MNTAFGYDSWTDPALGRWSLKMKDRAEVWPLSIRGKGRHGPVIWAFPWMMLTPGSSCNDLFPKPIRNPTTRESIAKAGAQAQTALRSSAHPAALFGGDYAPSRFHSWGWAPWRRGEVAGTVCLGESVDSLRSGTSPFFPAPFEPLRGHSWKRISSISASLGSRTRIIMNRSSSGARS